MKNYEIFRGAYKLEFKEVCQAPVSAPGFRTGNSFRLFFDPEHEGIDRIICTTRIRKVWVGNCCLAFPYFPVRKKGKPTNYSDGRDYVTYKCTSIRPVVQYQKQFTKRTGDYLFIHESDHSRPVGVAIRLIAKDIQQAEVYKESILAGKRSEHLFFWTPRSREWWIRHEAGCFSDGGNMYALKKDGSRFSYKVICSQGDFARILELAHSLPRYGYFLELLKELGYGAI